MGRARPSPRRTPRDQRRRSLGQNFLIDSSLVRRLVADVKPDDLVFDIGAGTGPVTLAAAAAGARVVAIERDEIWSARLRERVRGAGLGDRVRVVYGDLRDLCPPEGPWRVIANPPFNLTTALLKLLLDDPARGPGAVDLVIQWEVARKFAASPPATLLGSAWAPWWSMTLIERVPRTAFRPVPDVDAGWLHIHRRDPDLLTPGLAPAWEAFLRDAWPASGASPGVTRRQRR